MDLGSGGFSAILVTLEEGKSMLKLSIAALVTGGLAFGANVNAHAPIVIQSDQDFAACGCVMSGSGSATNPYVIGPWAINKIATAAVTIDGAKLTKSFVLWNLAIAGNGAGASTGIILKNIHGTGAAVQ